MIKSLKDMLNSDGTYKTDDRYKEIFRLDEMLTEKGIPHVIRKLMDGRQILYPENGENLVMDAIEHYGSYGNEQDLLEIMGLLTPEEKEYDSVVGYLTAKDVFARIEKHWNSINDAKK